LAAYLAFGGASFRSGIHACSLHGSQRYTIWRGMLILVANVIALPQLRHAGDPADSIAERAFFDDRRERDQSLSHRRLGQIGGDCLQMQIWGFRSDRNQ
jgi:hypothetical protein